MVESVATCTEWAYAYVMQANPRPGLKLKKIHWEVNDQVEGTVFSRVPTIRLPSAAFAKLEEEFQMSY